MFGVNGYHNGLSPEPVSALASQARVEEGGGVDAYLARSAEKQTLDIVNAAYPFTHRERNEDGLRDALNLASIAGVCTVNGRGLWQVL